ncbi:hypothetical protein [Bacillus sp. Marseille-Q1617]|uniref:hypothetical protein n=1 Tax=Bacillus sp. Marseille-Q1617 TaxID=2736887 RepID=UPI00158F2C99|nr:hypothetical protein [Bacillus sp. Marseille-Q1617]
MLSIKLHSITADHSIEQALVKLGFKKHGGNYICKNSKIHLEAEADFINRTIEISFSPQLNLEEYKTVHLLFIELIKELDAQYDDSGSLLGYLSEGTGAYILTNWEQWISFLQEAKFRTLEGKKVRVLDEAGKELAAGMFVNYSADVSSNIKECTVITLFGERTYKGDNLKVEATNEW